MRKHQPYHVTVHTPEGRTSYITSARNGVHAVSEALGMFPNAKAAKAKPVTQHRAG